MSKNRSSRHSSVEVKLEAVHQILELKRPVAEVAVELGLHRDTVNRWVNTYKLKGPEGLENPKAITKTSNTEDGMRIRELEKQLKEKELEIEILKKFQAFLKGKR